VTELYIPIGDGMSAAASQWGVRPAIVLLHAGVADRRSWYAVMGGLDRAAIAYDRPGFGETPASELPYSNVAHLAAVADHACTGPVVLVGNSQGGLIAIDYALVHPERVAGLVLIAPAISGAPEPDWESELGADLVHTIEQAEEADELDELNRWELRIWLDGPRQPEGRVGGAIRDLVRDMNRTALTNDLTGVGPAPEPVVAWEILEELAIPSLVLTCEHDVAGVTERAAELARRAPHARLVELGGVAHLPGLEDPAAVARQIDGFVTSIA
jgi:pimeloyl-ACP methyl ester carboxylesterase